MGRGGASRRRSGKQQGRLDDQKNGSEKRVEERWLSKSFSSLGAARISPVVAEGATIFSGKGRNEKKEEERG